MNTLQIKSINDFTYGEEAIQKKSIRERLDNYRREEL
jgi:hypothetical protein